MKIKICGLTDPKEAEYLNQNNVDFAGMVLFYPKSKRNITIDRARSIISALSTTISPVAVVVSPSPLQIRQIAGAGFDYIQIHGDLPSDWPREVNLPILKAFNVKDLPDFDRYMDMDEIAGFVMDADSPGSGKTFDWNLIKGLDTKNKLLILAGGLDSHNIKEAILCVKPDGVDVSSGVEYDDRPGKDPAKIREFTALCRTL